MQPWYRRLFSTSPRGESPQLAPGAAVEPPPPSWGSALLEFAQKSSRAQARCGALIEELERKLEGGFEELRQAVQSASGASVQPPLPWEELWDALDAIENAGRVPGSTLPAGVDEGLRRVLARLERFLAHAEMSRVVPVGDRPDGRLFRVVGTLEQPDLPEGVVARVVRAAIVRGDRVVREGEVLINRRMS